MLWYKGWLETRLRLLFTAAIIVFVLSVQKSVHWSGVTTAHAQQVLLGSVAFADAVPLVMVCAMLAGAGIATQPSFQATKGIHGSTLFTLSLPVSRLRLLATRAALGWLESCSVIALTAIGTWIASPLLRAFSTPVDVGEYALTLAACGSTLYSISVLLDTFLDDQWRTWGTMLAAGAIYWISSHVSLPASIDIVRAVGKNSPLFAHTMPWGAMGFSLALSACFFIAALKIVRTREY